MRHLAVVLNLLLLLVTYNVWGQTWTGGSEAGSEWSGGADSTGASSTATSKWQFKSDAGDNHLDIHDVDNDTDVVTIEQGAGASSLVIDSSGDTTLLGDATISGNVTGANLLTGGYVNIPVTAGSTPADSSISLHWNGTNFYAETSSSSVDLLTDAGGDDSWSTSGSDIYFNSGVAAIGTATPSATHKFYIEGDGSGGVVNMMEGKVTGSAASGTFRGVMGTSNVTGGDVCIGFDGYASGCTTNYGLKISTGDVLINDDILLGGKLTTQASDGTHYIDASNSGANDRVDCSDPGCTSYNDSDGKWHVDDGTDLGDTIVTNDSTNSDSGVVRWGNEADAVDTGTELCTLNHQTCVTTYELEDSVDTGELDSQSCAFVHTGNYIAFCY